uniref:Uncharacterized protein n=1 Tax=Cannabis sativa TaxID=3483 RepID=A0A803NIH5_CANSA
MPPPMDGHLQVVIGGPHIARDSNKARERYARTLQYEQKDGDNARTLSLNSIYLWVQIHDLQFVFLTMKVVRDGSNYVGTFLEFDPNNFVGVWCEYLRKDVVDRLRDQLSFDGGFCVEAQEILLPNTSAWRLTCIYEKPNRSMQFKTWKLIHDLAPESQLHWCIIEDLNNISSQLEKKGGRPYPTSLTDGFQEVLYSCGLVDLELQGYPYTWKRSKGGAFADELEKSDSFIPTSISEEEVPDARAIRQGSLSTDEIDRMVQELAEAGTIEIRDSKSTVSAQEYLTHSRHAPDIEVEEIREDFEVPDRESEEEENAEDRPARPVLDTARRKIAEVLEMTFLKQAPILNRKPKAGTAMTSPVILQKRKSEVVRKLNSLGQKPAKIAEAFRAMSPTKLEDMVATFSLKRLRTQTRRKSLMMLQARSQMILPL